MTEVRHRLPRTLYEPRNQDIPEPPETLRAVPAPSGDKGLKLGLPDIPLDIFLCIARFLDVKDVLKLRPVCKAFAKATREHPVWTTLVNQHIIQEGLPWPPWALPLTNVSTRTLEVLSVCVVRLVRWWVRKAPLQILKPSRCFVRPENSITWLSIFRSRWMMVQLNGRPMEFWDLQNPSNVTPKITFHDIDGIINGEKSLIDSADEGILTISTRANRAHALSLRLPAIGASRPDPHVELVQSWEGYSELLDASRTLCAFARCPTGQTAAILHRTSGRSVRLVGTEADQLLDIAGAIQISDQCVAVARRNRLDIYNTATVLSALDSTGHGSQTTISPSYSLAYPNGWIGSGLNFIPVRPSWLRKDSPTEEAIHLVLIEDDLGTSVCLVAHKQDDPAKECTEYQFEEPYYLFGGGSYWTVGVSWGISARRMIYAVNTPKEVFLRGVAIPLDPGGLDKCIPRMTRAVAEWSIPDGADDFLRYTVFEESTGVSVVAMASGCIWIMDPCATVAEVGDVWNKPNTTVPLYPDPAWPDTHPVPWFKGMDIDEEEDPIEDQDEESIIGQDEEMIEGQDSIPGWSSSVDQYFPGKNKQECFGGATWFVNEVLHIQGRAEVVLFTIPCSVPYPTTEVVQLDDRLIIIKRHESSGTHETRLLPSGATIEAVTTHLRAGSSLMEIPGTKLGIEELRTRRYSAWRGRVEPGYT